MAKSTPEQIRARFDADVERFSDLATGQVATIDAPLMMDLVARAAAAATPAARAVLDVGCGAGNYTLKLLQSRPGLDVTLVDLSRPMLDRAAQRVSAATPGRVEAIQGDVRELDLGEGRFDIILAAMVLHHLRTDAEWSAVFSASRRALRPGGSLWIADMVAHEAGPMHDLMWARYGDYLVGAGGAAYRDKVFAYIEQEDTPQTLPFQLEALRRAGFDRVEVLHKNGPFAAFGGLLDA